MERSGRREIVMEMDIAFRMTLCQMIQELIDEHKAGRERRKQLPHLFFTSFLDYEDREQIPEFLDEWEDASKWLQGRYAHLRS